MKFPLLYREISMVISIFWKLMISLQQDYVICTFM
uniref:Uncharacterized protein n=1 Tax=Arundo donax TaxID=35708 RepID=A0A0A9ASH0_ARUDO